MRRIILAPLAVAATVTGASAADAQYGRPGYGGGEGRWNDERGYGGERGYEGSRGYQGSRGYDATRAYEGSRGGYQGSGGNYQSGGGYQGSREEEGSRGAVRHGDYGPGAFNRQFRGGTEYFGTGQRGYGTTWGGQGGGYSGQTSYLGGQGGYSGGIGSYGEQGRHAGRGPKGYQRSDERIREDICERLTHHPEINAEEIEIQVKNAEVTLIGTVERREEKRMAEDVTESISGVKDVHNQLRTQQHAMMGGQGSQGNKQETGGGPAAKTK